MTEVCHSLEESLLMIAILEDRARNASWLWKLVPLGWLPASFITQYKVYFVLNLKIIMSIYNTNIQNIFKVDQVKIGANSNSTIAQQNYERDGDYQDRYGKFFY